MSKDTYYVTTPIYYVNDLPHIGHAYTTIAADILNRYHTLLKQDSFFLTGTDEHAKSSLETATEKGEEVQEYVRKMSNNWQKTWQELDISNSAFIRTSSPQHKQGVLEFFSRVYAQGDIYKGHYKGLYCSRCEEFKTKRDLDADDYCPIHKIKCQAIEEENYFFRLTKYKEQLLQHYQNNPHFIQPSGRRKEVLNYVQDYMEDISISRQGLSWGIKLPLDPTHTIYVWFDALINYLTGIGFGHDEKHFKHYWPANVHLVGRDITKFHCALWPAMLMSAKLELPKQIFVHGFFTLNGEKMSKTLGNTINPLALKNQFTFDAIRYYLFSEIPFGADGDFSLSQLKERYNAKLAHGLGNLCARVAKLAERTNADYNLTPPSLKERQTPEYQTYMDSLNFQKALEYIWNKISLLDKEISENKIWEQDDVELTLTLKAIIKELLCIGILLQPLLPATANTILNHFSQQKITALKPLYPKML